MAVTSVTEIHEGTGAKFDYSLGRTYTRAFRVITDSFHDCGPVILLAPGIPRPGAIYASGNAYDLGAVCKSIDPRRSEADPSHWIVTCTYEPWVSASQLRGKNPELQEALSDLGRMSDTGSATAGSFDPKNPLTFPPRISLSFREVQKVWDWKDLDGRSVTNAVGDPFNPAIETTKFHPVLTWRRNENPPNPSDPLAWLNWLNQRQDSVNSDTWLGSEAYTWKMRVSAERQFDQGVKFWEVTYEAEYNREAWYPYKILDVGFRALQPNAAGTLKAVLDPNTNTAMPYPVPLKSDGTILPYLGDLHYKEFSFYHVYEFAAFNLNFA